MDGQGDPTVYLHGDMVRSTMLMTDETGSAGVPPASLAYTAFGEPVTYDAGSETWRVGFPAAGGMGGSPVTRYQYAGGFGYESGLITLQGVNPALPPVTLQHVGERWYDPALGRFVQRDPIGLAGGFNVYVYCDADPLSWHDATGLDRWLVGDWHEGIIVDNHDGTYTRYDFGPKGGVNFWGLVPPFSQQGQIVHSTATCINLLLNSGDQIKSRRYSDEEDDAEIQRRIRTYRVPRYNVIDFNCRRWARDVLRS